MIAKHGCGDFTYFSLLICKPTSLLTPDMVSGYVFIYGIYAFARQIDIFDIPTPERFLKTRGRGSNLWNCHTFRNTHETV